MGPRHVEILRRGCVGKQQTSGKTSVALVDEFTLVSISIVAIRNEEGARLD